jgi:hypothetical protein
MPTLDKAKFNITSDAEPNVFVDPPCRVWPALLDQRPTGELFGKSLADWRSQCRAELKLDVNRPIIATGHQTLLWHPGILAKYLVVDAVAKKHALATANLIVDQHAEGFGDFEIPIRRDDGSLSVRRIELCRPKPRKEVPMGRHESFTPPRPPENLSGAIESVNKGARQIFDAVYAHRTAPNAALQMADALADLMRDWAAPLPIVTATNLIHTSLARRMIQAMAEDPHRCAECYNRAVAAVPEGGLHRLMIRDDYVELPLWRIRSDGRRMHAYDNDLVAKVDLLPRALFMTSLVRLCMCDLFVHGKGGARYDRAMEIWIEDWLGIVVGSIAIASADVRLPLVKDEVGHVDLVSAVQAARHAFHDPEQGGGAHRELPSPVKSHWLRKIDELQRNSTERKSAFLRMHEALASARQQSVGFEQSRQVAERAKRTAADAHVAMRRDWAFPLYPQEMIDDLAERMRRCADTA